jgi:hypothetical protein
LTLSIPRFWKTRKYRYVANFKRTYSALPLFH